MAYYKFPDNTVVEFTDYVPTDSVVIGRKEFDTLQKAKAREYLLKMLKPNDIVTTICVHQPAGMVRHHKVLVVHDGMINDITWHVAKAAGFRLAKNYHAIVQSGGGYSKGFQIVYALGSSLWPNGTDKPHGTRNGEPDSNGGYALKHGSI